MIHVLNIALALAVVALSARLYRETRLLRRSNAICLSLIKQLGAMTDAVRAQRQTIEQLTGELDLTGSEGR